MKNKPILFIVNDFSGHGGHIKSFVSHLKAINTSYDFKIICSKEGYISKNLHNLEFIKEEDLIYFNFTNMNKYQFDFNFYKLLKSVISDNYIIHTYSFEAIFMMSLLKLKYKNISTIVSVMGGLNPFPYLSLMDKYIAVSEEQKEDAIKFSDTNSSAINQISIIKNRIIINNSINEQNHGESILIITRFDNDKLASLKKIFELVNIIEEKHEILIAGNGSLLEEYKLKYEENSNIKFLGYVNNLDQYLNKIKFVMGMGRSILEFMLQNKSAILIGYKGIEILDTVKKVEFASKYNFSGREIYEDKTIHEIKNYIDNTPVFNKKEILGFLTKEYDISFYKEKYNLITKSITSKNITYFLILKCYFHIFMMRLKRKIKK